MKKLLLTGIAIVSCVFSFGQKIQKDRAIMKEVKGGTGYYFETIMKDAREVEARKEPVKISRRFQVDFKGMELPNKYELYKTNWHNNPVSQGNTSTCWSFCTTSYFESEVYRQSGLQAKLSEMYTVYWEYIEKAKGFVRKRGNSAFAQGSESNAVTGNYKKYGIVPLSDYPGKVNNEKFYNHDIMYNEMNSYLQSVKKNNSWNEEEVISTIKSILNTYMGAPPAEITYDGRKYTPKQYLSEVLKLNMDDYVDILSYMQKPFWKKVEYDVDDNWWHDSTYYNVPAEVFIGIIKKAVRSGYTIAIGGDVSEPGFDREYQVGIVPTFDIPSEYIDDYAKQMRFTDKITQDDHGMHIVGYTEKNGRDWYLVKDSGSGSRNNNPNAKEFGYYFINEDYVKLKMMDFTIHKDAVKEIISKF